MTYFLFLVRWLGQLVLLEQVIHELVQAEEHRVSEGRPQVPNDAHFLL